MINIPHGEDLDIINLTNPLMLAAPALRLVDVVWDRGADEVVADAEESEEHLVAAHNLREVADPGHLQEQAVDGRQDVPVKKWI